MFAKLNKIVPYFITFMLGLIVGYAWAYKAYSIYIK